MAPFLSYIFRRLPLDQPAHRLQPAPGIVNSFLAWSARAMPFELLLPLVSWLMKPRVRRVTGTAPGVRLQKLGRKLLPR